MDNRYFNYGCPALMQDARFITNYYPNRGFEQHIRNVNNIKSAQDYKLFLQRNGDTIVNREVAYLTKLNTCSVNGKCVPMGKNPDNVIAQSCGCNCKK
jgi:hypothetical protein